MDTLSIGQVASRARVGIETIRFYEREGLLEEPPRCASGYRQYSEQVVKHIHFIKRAQKLGFSLKEAHYLFRHPGRHCRSSSDDFGIVTHPACRAV